MGSRHTGKAQWIFLKSNSSSAGPETQMGGLGAPLLHYRSPKRRYSRGRPQRQARYNDRNLGTQKSGGTHGAEGEATKNARHLGDAATAGGFERP